MKQQYEVGEYIIYNNGDQYEIGRVKKVFEDRLFICFHEGETAASTPYEYVHKILNKYVIKETTLGGEVFK